jgi:uncharacterized repeat protein (TIGR03806 family)
MRGTIACALRYSLDVGTISGWLLLGACSSDGDATVGSGGHGGAQAGSGGAGGEGTGADGGATAVTPAPEGAPYETLSEWHLFENAALQEPNAGVIPYDVNAPLFSDYTSKHRFIYVPEGTTIGYDALDKWEFPVGTILIKTFAYAEDLRDETSPQHVLETRLLVRNSDAWVPITYVWNEEQTEATKKLAGDIIDWTFTDREGSVVQNAYVVPNTNECLDCHGEEPNTLGGRTRQLNRTHEYDGETVNQIDHLAELGLLDVEPEAASERQTLVDPFGAAPLEERVRAYVDANCGHCHAPGNTGDSGSGLWLDFPSTDPATRTNGSMGICKVPTSAGGATCERTFDIVPGDPDASILMCRVESHERQVQMPPLGRNLAHAEGAALLREWILSLEGTCEATP